MSKWYEIKEKNIDDIDLDDKKEDIHFYAGWDDDGNNYVYMKIDFLIKWLKDKKLI